MQLTYDELIEILDIKYFPSKRVDCSLNPGTYEITDINKTLEHILPDIVKAGVTDDDIRLKSNLKKSNFSTTKKFFS